MLLSRLVLAIFVIADSKIRILIAQNTFPGLSECGLSESIVSKNKTFPDFLANAGEFMWTVLIQELNTENKKTYVSCNGILIHSQYVLTTARCLKPPEKEYVLNSVILGEHERFKSPDCISDGFCPLTPTTIDISESFVHEKYKDEDQDYNIGLIRLNTTGVNFSKFLRPICMPSTIPDYDPPVVGEPGLVSGWGGFETSDLPRIESNVKVKINYAVENFAFCKHAHQNRRKPVFETEMCSGSGYGPDLCGLIAHGAGLYRKIGGNWVLDGIKTRWVECGSPEWPHIFTKVSSHEGWIKEKIGSRSFDNFEYK